MLDFVAHFLLYFVLGFAQGLISTGLVSAIAKSQAYRAAALDLLIGISGFVAVDALINHNILSVVAYLLGGCIGTFILVKFHK